MQIMKSARIGRESRLNICSVIRTSNRVSLHAISPVEKLALAAGIWVSRHFD